MSVAHTSQIPQYAICKIRDEHCACTVSTYNSSSPLSYASCPMEDPFVPWHPTRLNALLFLHIVRANNLQKGMLG